ncbi:polysaccharide pyruvyl transferase family protein [Halalkalibacter lacteus]|uniref:polysaccharide pyruvyl transferase family protein n=1 Tax=Halalkalibacter lacteus TaxID=3090663 RepID=UPI002FC9EC92
MRKYGENFVKKKILYLGWLGFNNLGDELMWEIFREICKKEVDLTKVEIIPSNKRVDKNVFNGFDAVILGGGSLLVPNYIDLLYHAMKQHKKIIIWGSGVDWIEKPKLIKIQNNKRVANHFFSPSVEEKLREIIKYASYVGVRGPLTYKVLSQMGVDMQKVEQSGDPGLLLKNNQNRSAPLINGWNSNENIIGVNWGTALNRIYGRNEQAVEKQLIKAINQLINQGYKIYIYNVWEEDVAVNKRLYQKLQHSNNVKWSPNLYHQDELLKLIKRFVFTINLKLHANVISACAGIPFIALGYRFKVFDFAKSIGLSKMVISTDSNMIDKEILKLAREIQRNKPQMIKRFETSSFKSREKLTAAIKKYVK